uniref:Transmembrane protein 198 n=1 Tax=Albugo laibachii Nc14 TaxID=890382 RepID=F0WP76_9STRA|nr:conserved hypothetical protein [Albugo laibachii Nc14]|eukprot:CCA23122.1 conserved hypothetical protein [Albugo laibachii Nc14]
MSRYCMPLLSARIALCCVLIQYGCAHILRVLQDASVDSASRASIFDSSSDMVVGKNILAIAAIVGGALIGFAGQRLFRPTMFICAFSIGGLVLSGIVVAIFGHRTWIGTASWVSFLIGGVILAGLVLTVYNVGIFIVGAAFGIMLAATVNNSIGYLIYPDKPTTLFVIMACIFALVGGLLAFKAERLALIVATSMIGAHAMIWGLGYYAGHYPNPMDLTSRAVKRVDGSWSYSIPTQWWGYLVGIILLFILCMLVQCKKTAKV